MSTVSTGIRESGELTEPAKSAVRRYMLSLFAIPSVLVPVLFGALGYLVGNVFTAKAYQDAHREALTEVQKSYREAWSQSQAAVLAASADATKAVASAEHARVRLLDLAKEFEKARTSLEKEGAKAKELQDELRQQSSVEALNGNIEKIADLLRKDAGFQAGISRASQAELEAIHRRISGISIKARNATESPSFVCGQQQQTSPDSPLVMYGSRDGTSCGVPNRNLYKELYIYVPN